MMPKTMLDALEAYADTLGGYTSDAWHDVPLDDVFNAGYLAGQKAAVEAATQRQPMDTAPKDEQVLLDIGLPWLVIGHYNKPHGEWVYASSQAELLEDGCSYYYENDYEKTPKGWMKLPEVTR